MPFTAPFTAPFGGPVVSSITGIQDQAYNSLFTPASGQMQGWQEPTTAEEALALRIYMFLIEGIRGEDQQNGNLFLKRWLEGPQTIWAATQRTIFSINDLWDVTAIQDRFLPYLKRIVGWTPDLDGITDALDDDTLRRLIAASVALWKVRGTDSSLSSVVSLVAGARSRIWDWFDFRWILDETGMGHEHDGRDPWTISIEDDRTFNFRIVDNGTLNRALARGLAKLMRPMGERVEITYLAAMDLFSVDGDNAQWYTENANAIPLRVANGVGELTLPGDSLEATINSAGPFEDYIFTARIKGTFDFPTGFWGVLFCYQDHQNHYVFGAYEHGWQLLSVILNASSLIADSGTSWVGGTVFPGTYYSIRVQVSPEAGQTRIIAYVDGVEVFNLLDPSWSIGPPGIFRSTAQAGVTISEIEVLRLPAESDTVGINS